MSKNNRTLLLDRAQDDKKRILTLSKHNSTLEIAITNVQGFAKIKELEDTHTTLMKEIKEQAAKNQQQQALQEKYSGLLREERGKVRAVTDKQAEFKATYDRIAKENDAL